MASYGLPARSWTAAPLDELPAAERLLAEALRRWGCEAARGAPPLPGLRLLLAAENAEAAAAPLDLLLRSLAEAGQPPALGSPLCPRLCPEEAELLLACALAQRGTRGEALAALARWLPPFPAYAVLPTLIRIGLALRRAGLLFRHPLRSAPPRR
ncbi:hypothetical protein GCM10010964_26020 [Caldovatus sediminis]|uniref:Uncharacterized protein n=1 Tax=Caldovatus sediminis TaxID=2041189 RepID=A0A8J3EE50_9PROT|nr:hypothetical protein [Caldovatus sediminis]GGG37000.1 hypothetical protein GCM10010964_26020 [Caldovatus sediminis]